MNIPGYAFTEGWEQKRDNNSNRFLEIRNIPGVKITSKRPAYARTYFEGVLETPEAKALSEMDLALIADHGSLCFGGDCTKSGERFYGSYYTD